MLLYLWMITGNLNSVESCNLIFCGNFIADSCTLHNPLDSVGLNCARSLDNSIKVWLSKWRRNSRTNHRELQWEDQHNEKDGTQVFEHLKILNACLKFFVDGLLFECRAWIFANQQEPLAPKGLPARFLDSVMIPGTVVLCTLVRLFMIVQNTFFHDISGESKKSEYVNLSMQYVCGGSAEWQWQVWLHAPGSVMVSACVSLCWFGKPLAQQGPASR